MRLYSEALLEAAGDLAAYRALLLNRSAAHAGIGQWQDSLADADQVLRPGGKGPVGLNLSCVNSHRHEREVFITAGCP